MRILIVSILLVAAGVITASAQDSERVMVPAVKGAIVRGYMQDDTGQAVLGEIQITGSSPDDLFNYWVGYNGQTYFGYDVYREVWRPGPVEYVKASLRFQNESVEGWLRSFNGMVDRDFFFGVDGVVYQRFYNEQDGVATYSYFVHTLTGQRSDSLELLRAIVTDSRATQAIVEQQAMQMEQFLAEFSKRGADYPYWRQKGSVLPRELPSIVSWGGVPQGALTREVPAGQPSLLELIEDEVGPLSDDPADESETAGEDPASEE